MSRSDLAKCGPERCCLSPCKRLGLVSGNYEGLRPVDEEGLMFKCLKEKTRH